MNEIGPEVWKELAFKDFSILGSGEITLAQEFRRSKLLKQIIHNFLYLALAAILFIGAKQFELFGRESPK